MGSDRRELLNLDLEVAVQLRLRRVTIRDAERAAGRARALADPTRLMLAVALGKAEELCVCDLAWIAERSQNLVSHHLRALRVEGLVRSRRAGKMVMYALTEECAALVDVVLGSPEAVTRERSRSGLSENERTVVPRAARFVRATGSASAA